MNRQVWLWSWWWWLTLLVSQSLIIISLSLPTDSQPVNNGASTNRSSALHVDPSLSAFSLHVQSLQIKLMIDEENNENMKNTTISPVTDDDSQLLTVSITLGDWYSCEVPVRVEWNTWINVTLSACPCFTSSDTYSICVNISESETECTELLILPQEQMFVTLPDQVEALQDEVVLNMDGWNQLCLQDSTSPDTIQKAYLILRHSYQPDIGPVVLPRNQVATVDLEVEKMTSLSHHVFGCEQFDRGGVYQSELWLTYRNKITNQTKNVNLASSNVMKVNWWKGYALRMRTDGVNPGCNGHLRVSYDGPRCDAREGNGQTRVRLYGIIDSRRNSVARPRRLRYIEEKKLIGNQKFVEFFCGRFDLMYLGFCFKLITVYEDGYVREQAVQCVPMDKKTVIVNGGWSEWQSWGTCSNKCGQGLRYRTRTCNNPKPNQRGADCPGAAVESEQCLVHTGCETKNETLTTSANWTCECGCNMTTMDTLLLLGKCVTDATWTLYLPSDDHIAKLTSLNRDQILQNPFVATEGMEETTEKEYEIRVRIMESLEEAGYTIRIRDGPTATSSLLFDSSLMSSDSWVDTSILTRSRSASIEYRVWGNDTEDKHTVLVHVTASVQQPSPRVYVTEESVWWNGGTERQDRILVWLSAAIVAALVLICCVVSPLSIACLYTHAKRRLSMQFRRLPSSQSLSRHGHCNEGQGEFLCAQREQQLSGDGERAVPQTRTQTDMQTSTHTQSTRLSAMSVKQHKTDAAIAVCPPSVPQVTKRNVGVQLWPMDSPGPSNRRGSAGSRNGRSTSPRRQLLDPAAAGATSTTNQSSLSLAGTEQDFEYDYYEPGIPGSYLFPQMPLIDIDEIIGDSELMAPTPESSRQKQEPLTTRSVSVSTDSAPRSL